MEGRQKEIWENIMDIVNKIEGGMYGKGNDIDEKEIYYDLEICVDHE